MFAGVNTVSNKIRIGVSACLLGEQVRFDGGHKKNHLIIDKLSEHFDYRSFCPEVAIGMGIPREPIRLVQEGEMVRVKGVKNENLDVTDKLREITNKQQNWIDAVDGYIVKKDSPSCGLHRVKRYHGKQALRDGRGAFAEQLLINNPALPVEEEGRLNDEGLRQSFVERVFAHARWQRLQKQGLTKQGLIDYHSRHKYVLMSHCPQSYRSLGKMLSNLPKQGFVVFANEYFSQLMSGLSRVATRAKHANVLHHLQGYLKHEIESGDRQELRDIIEQYRIGKAPIEAAAVLMRHHFRHNPDPYIANSYYLAVYDK